MFWEVGILDRHSGFVRQWVGREETNTVVQLVWLGQHNWISNKAVLSLVCEPCCTGRKECQVKEYQG